MQQHRPAFRFAPSPNGELHLGHAFSALFTAQMARRLNGRFLLRIEDIDRERSLSTFEAAIYEDLRWLGLEWETPVRRQSEHFADYAAALRKLKALGVIYPCFATRKEIAAAIDASQNEIRKDPDGVPLYPGLYRGASPAKIAGLTATGKPYALRLDIGKAARLAMEKSGAPLSFRSFDSECPETIEQCPAFPERWGDVIIARKDTPASYHLCVTVDDALQGITHITRGMDLYAATGIHRLLQILLDLPEPLYCHHRLILDGNGRKLAKSHKDKALRQMRAEGASAENIKEMLGFSPQ